MPRTAGTIVPNHAMGGANVTVNVDASGSSVQGDGSSAQQLGKAIGAAVQAELITKTTRRIADSLMAFPSITPTYNAQKKKSAKRADCAFR